MRDRPYARLAVALAVGVAAVFFAGYALIERAEHMHFSVNHLYVALMAMSPLGVLMLFLLGEAFPNRRANALLSAAFAAVFLASFAGARTQTGVGDDAFLGTMIAHHSHAVMSCRNATLTDPRIVAFCDRMVERHHADIAELEAIMARR